MPIVFPFWARKAYGNKPKKTPLPEGDDECRIVQDDSEPAEVLAHELVESIESSAKAEREPEAHFKVGDNLQGCHELGKLAWREVEDSQKD